MPPVLPKVNWRNSLLTSHMRSQVNASWSGMILLLSRLTLMAAIITCMCNLCILITCRCVFQLHLGGSASILTQHIELQSLAALPTSAQYGWLLLITRPNNDLWLAIDMLNSKSEGDV